jgi:hypothetical protein
MADLLPRGAFIRVHSGGRWQVARVVRVEQGSGWRRIICAYQRNDGVIVGNHAVKSISPQLERLSDADVAAYRADPEFSERLDFAMPGDGGSLEFQVHSSKAQSR